MSEQDQDIEISLDSLEDVLGLSTEEEQEETPEEAISEILGGDDEEEEEKPKESKKPSKKIEEPKVKTDESKEKEHAPVETEFFQKAKTLIDLGFIDDLRISTSDDENDEGVLLSESVDLTQEQFQAILDSHKETKQTEIKNKYISKENISEDNMKFIEILQNGGSITDLFETPEEAVRPFSGLDITDQKDQARMALSYYMKHKGNTVEEATSIVREIVKNGSLEDFAQQVFDYENKQYDKKLEDKNLELIKKTKEEKEKVKKVTGDLRVKLKEAKFKDQVSKKLIDSVTKKDENGSLPIRKAFEALLENPSENYEKLLHILDEKAFNDLYNIKKQKTEGLKTLRILEAIPKTRKTQTIKDNNETGNNSLHSILLGED